MEHRLSNGMPEDARLLEKAQCASPEKLARVKEYFRTAADVRVSEEVLDRSAGIAVAMEELCAGCHLDMVTVKCLGEFIDSYACCCLALAWANAQGMVAACQCNINAMLSMYALRQMGAQDIYFGDVTVDMERRLRRSNCASIPFGLHTVAARLGR